MSQIRGQVVVDVRNARAVRLQLEGEESTVMREQGIDPSMVEGGKNVEIARLRAGLGCVRMICRGVLKTRKPKLKELIRAMRVIHTTLTETLEDPVGTPPDDLVVKHNPEP